MTRQFEPYSIPRRPEAAMLDAGRRFCEQMQTRRSVRHFSSDPVPQEMIAHAIAAAGTAPSGAHRQPWRFVAVCDAELKREIRIAAEAEEKKLYEGGRLSEEWREALVPLGTNWEKPYLEIVPWIVVLFEEVHSVAETGEQRKNYYVKESVGIACGMFLTALHQMGLAALTHTPSPMGFLQRLLERPKNERPFVLIPIGYPATDCQVPALTRKPLSEIAIWR